MQTYVAPKGHRQLPPLQEQMVQTKERGAGSSAAIAQMSEVLNQSARVQSLLQTKQMLHAGPPMAAQRALQRALNPGFGQEAVQREARPDEKELTQAKFDPKQRPAATAVPGEEEEETLQGIFDPMQQQPAVHSEPAQPREPNRTGLPDDLKAGMETLSGFSLSDVRVHYNSPQPSQLHALAYAQGTDIHVAPGQERHLPHEAWHVVQQKQGRVKPTLQKKGVAINDDAGLEREADAMGGRLANLGAMTRAQSQETEFGLGRRAFPIQAKLFITHGEGSAPLEDWENRTKQTGGKDPFPNSAAKPNKNWNKRQKKQGGTIINDQYFWIVRRLIDNLVNPYQHFVSIGQSRKVGNKDQTEITTTAGEPAMEKLQEDYKSAGFRLVYGIINSKKEVVIDPWDTTEVDPFKTVAIDLKQSQTPGHGSGSKVHFGLYEPHESAVPGPLIGNKPKTQKSDPKIVLGHELIHAEHNLRGTAIPGETKTEYQVIGHPEMFAYANEEEQQTVGLGRNRDLLNITENELRKQHGIPKRISYHMYGYKTRHEKLRENRVESKRRRRREEEQRSKHKEAEELRKEEQDAKAPEQLQAWIKEANEYVRSLNSK